MLCVFSKSLLDSITRKPLETELLATPVLTREQKRETALCSVMLLTEVSSQVFQQLVSDQGTNHSETVLSIPTASPLLDYSVHASKHT